MKSTQTIATLLAALALGGACLAQKPGEGRREGGRQGGGVNRRVLEQLNLTAEQKTRLKAITDKQREETTALRKKHLDQINAILKPEQRKKLEELRASQRGGAEGGGRNGGGKGKGKGKGKGGA